MLDFIINPSAGKKNGAKIKKILPKLEKMLTLRGQAYRFHLTTGCRHATTLTDSLIKKGATDIVVVGGDGTLHEVINGFSNFENVSLGIIPFGTGNDFAGALNLPLNPEKALELILLGKPKYTDFLQMPTVRGLNIIGMGIDVDVLKRYALQKRKSKFQYTKCLIKTLFNFNYSEFDVEMNGEKTRHRSFIACIANGNRYGGGIPICPPAIPYDKQLDFVAVKEIKRLAIIGSFIKLKKGKLLSLKQASHSNMQEIKIYPKGDYTVNVDGELYDNIPFEVKIVSDKLRVYRP